MATTSTDRRRGVNIGSAIKVPCRAATTANITLSATQTIDGVALVAGDRCLVKNQTTGSENGIYEVSTSAWQRTKDWDGDGEIKKGTLVYVHSGTASGWWYVSTSDPITIGTTAVTLTQSSSTLAVISAFMQTMLDDADGATALTTMVNSATGITARSILTAERDFLINVLDHGAVGNGAANDTAAIQAALNAVPSSGGIVFFPIGTYLTSAAALTITKPTIVLGAGVNSVVKQTSTTLDCFQVNTVDQVIFRDIAIHQAASAIAGSGILVSGSGGVQSTRTKILNCFFKDNWIGITMARAAQFKISDCDFMNQQNFGIALTDTLSSDSDINSCHFGTGIPTAVAGISQTCCPGIRISNNKFLGFIYGIQISVSLSTSTINIVGNSLENQATAGIQFQQAVAAQTVGSVVITGNQFANAPTCITVDTGGAWIENVAITGNAFAPSVTGINLSGGNRFTISGNQFQGVTNGIIGSPNNTNIFVAGNSFYNVTNKFSGTFSGIIANTNGDSKTESAGGTITPYGLSIVGSTVVSVYNLTAPVVGVENKTVACSCGSSEAYQHIKLASGNFMTSAGSSFTVAQFSTAGQSLSLVPLSTNLWIVRANMGLVGFTTTT